MSTGTALERAAEWLLSTLTGPVALAIATIAIAWVGLMMLGGRIDLRRGGIVILGCFILFSASTIALGLRALADAGVPFTSAAAPAPQLSNPPPRAINDPYAGASVPIR